MGEDASESASVTLERVQKRTYEFVVNNYSQLCKEISADKKKECLNKRIESEYFDVGGYSWQICFYYAGHSVEAFDSGYVSLYVYLETEVDSPVLCFCELHLVDQSGKGNDIGVRNRSFKETVRGTFSLLEGDTLIGFDFFAKRTHLESSDCLQDDCLRIRATIGVVSPQFEKLDVLKVPQRTIGTDLGTLLGSNRRGADVLFMVAGEIFCAHKCIVAARCPVFRARFSDAPQQHLQVIKITDVEPGVFKAMLQFIYTGNLPKEEQGADSSFHASMPDPFMVKMLAAAHQFELKRLKKICESHILEKVSTESVVYSLHLALVYDAAELKAVCLRFLAENEVDIAESHGSEYLRETCPSLFLDLIGCKENSCTKVEEEHDSFRKILYTVKESVFGMFAPPYAKMKDLQVHLRVFSPEIWIAFCDYRSRLGAIYVIYWQQAIFTYVIIVSI